MSKFYRYISRRGRVQ